MATATETTKKPRIVKMVPARKAAPKATAKPVKKAATATDEIAPRRKPRYTGKTSGLGVMEYQNQSLEQNFKRKLTDDQIAEEWRKEFPMAVKFTAATVKAVRAQFNKGTHGPQDAAPQTLSRPYDDEGNALRLRGEKDENGK